METAARKYSRQMDGFEFLVHTGPPPTCLRETPDGADDENSVDSSLLSEPFSDYAPLEDSSEAGLQGQLTKFSPQFQATMQDIQAKNPVKNDDSRRSSKSGKSEKINWEKVLGGTKLDLEIPLGLIISEDEEVNKNIDLTSSRDENGIWRMLEQYTEFSLSLDDCGAALGRTQHWLDQAQTQSGTRETALGKCALWLEKNVPVPQFRNRAVPEQEIQAVLLEPDTPRPQTAKTFKENEKSMWNKAKSLQESNKKSMWSNVLPAT